MSALEIVKVVKTGTNNTQKPDSTNTAKSWWQENFVTLPEIDTDEIILTVSRSKALLGAIDQKTIKQLQYAGFSVLRVNGEFKQYPSLYIQLSQNLKWEGIKTILENCGYKVTVIAG